MQNIRDNCDYPAFKAFDHDNVNLIDGLRRESKFINPYPRDIRPLRVAQFHVELTATALTGVVSRYEGH